jgi:hypothetical protein
MLLKPSLLLILLPPILRPSGTCIERDLSRTPKGCFMLAQSETLGSENGEENAPAGGPAATPPLPFQA